MARPAAPEATVPDPETAATGPAPPLEARRLSLSKIGVSHPGRAFVFSLG